MAKIRCNLFIKTSTSVVEMPIASYRGALRLLIDTVTAEAKDAEEFDLSMAPWFHSVHYAVRRRLHAHRPYARLHFQAGDYEFRIARAA